MALKGGPSVGATRGSGYAPAYRPDAPVTLEVRPLSACAEIIDAWSHLAGRALEPNPFFEPGFALAAAHHLVAFRDVVAILAWQGATAGPQRRLLGLIPVFPRQGLFLPDALVGFGDRRILNGAPLLDRERAGAVIAAVLDPRRQRLLDGHGLVLRAIDGDGPLAVALCNRPGSEGVVARFKPRQGFGTGVPSSDAIAAFRATLSGYAKLTLAEPRTQGGLRDAAEIILAMEASGRLAQAGRATLQDTREVGFLRAMTRGLGRARQCRISLLMLGDDAIAGAIMIGRGPRAWLYLGAQDETHATLQPLAVLLALMRRTAPNRAILLPEGGVAGEAHRSIGDLHLSRGEAMVPRDLAGRARDAWRRSLVRLAGSRLKPPRAGAA
ncbi:GNAT family N-acetyltransferase [Bosea sp. AAP35]|uniref:GNAT family N-acetyltransferase n=1 Tax=Bosea sp. AAP35 TaxID=1523417 RepID=UPI0012E0E949|nr:GNAT family N-acetyltransferase [Bosea sp. AAP35]